MAEAVFILFLTMIEVKKREGESPAALVYRFTKKVKRSGVLKEAKKRVFRDRPLNKRKVKESALNRERKRQEIERLRKSGLL